MEPCAVGRFARPIKQPVYYGTEGVICNPKSYIYHSRKILMVRVAVRRWCVRVYVEEGAHYLKRNIPKHKTQVH